MKRVRLSSIACTLGLLLVVHASAISQANPEVLSPSTKTGVKETLVAELAKSINVAKAKSGDRIETRLIMDLVSGGQIVFPRGTTIVGHIISATAQSKEAPGSTVLFSFDRLVVKNRREIPLKAAVQALGAPLQTSLSGSEGVSDLDLAAATSSRPAPGRNEMKSIAATTFPGTRQAPNAASPDQTAATVAAAPVNATRSLGPASRGVIGMKGISLSETPGGSAIRSNDGNLRLRRGTQIVLRIVELQPPASLPK
jgi:hypothetical protein